MCYRNGLTQYDICQTVTIGAKTNITTNMMTMCAAVVSAHIHIENSQTGDAGPKKSFMNLRKSGRTMSDEGE